MLTLGRKRHLAAAGSSVVALAAVTGLVYALRPVAPDITLGVLYVFAVVPVAIVWGLAYAIPVSVASMLAFNFLFLPPVHSFTLRDTENWTALAVYVVTAVSVSQLAAAARARAAESQQRERQASLLAEVSAGLLRSGDVQGQLREIGASAARALGASRGWIELDSIRRPGPDEKAYELDAGERHVGTLFLNAAATPDEAVARQLLPALASLLAVAIDRERLGQKALETETLRRSDAIKTAILRAVSHDLRSPLTAIRAAAEGLESGALDLTATDRASLLDTIGAEVRRLDRLVGNLLDLSRLEAGAADPRPELRSVDDLVAAALEGLGSDDDRVVSSLPAEPLFVRTDPAQIERILVNLLENALRFSPAGAPAEVGVELVEREVVIRITDSGPGLPARELERIFEPFLPGRTRETGAGAGLGLAIVRGFAQANGGRVWAESGEGRGTSFFLALPAAEIRASAPLR